MGRRARSSAIPAIVAVTVVVLVACSAGSADDGSFVGVPAEQIGVNGPTTDILDGLELVGKSALAPPGKAPVGNHGGIALIGDCAYVGRWHEYNARTPVQIVNIADPAAPTVVGGVPNSVVSGGVTRELRAVDLPGRQMLVALVFAQGTGDRVNNQLRFFTFADGDCRKPTLAGTFDMRAFKGHEFFLWVSPEGRVLVFVTAPITPPNVFVVDATDPGAPTLVGVYDGAQPVVSVDEAAAQYLGTYAHSISLSDGGARATFSYWDGGFFTVNSTAFTLGTPVAAFAPAGAMSVPLRHPVGEVGNAHSAVEVPGTDVTVAAYEIYESTDGCPYGWMRLFDRGSVTTGPSILADFKLDANEAANCIDVPGTAPLGGIADRRTIDRRNAAGDLIDGTFSIHNQTVVGRYVLASWYGAGLRIVNVASPRNPAEVAYYVPEPLTGKPTSIPNTSAPIWGTDADSDNDWLVGMWSYPIVRDGLIYVTDIRNGLSILRATPGSPLAVVLDGTAFAEGNSNLGARTG